MADNKSYDQTTFEKLLQMGLPTNPAAAPIRRSKESYPYTLDPGVPGATVRNMPVLENTNTRGFVFTQKGEKPVSDTMFVRPSADQQTIAHEAEHLLAKRGLGRGSSINSKFDELYGDNGQAARNTFVRNAVDMAPYLEKKYGITDGYFSPDMLRFQGPYAPNLFYEQLASLSAAENVHGVDLTKDPELRKTLFADPKVRELYNALTGLRQTRLDSKDLPPYTPQPEPGYIDKLKKLIGFAKGGSVDNAGNKKLI